MLVFTKVKILKITRQQLFKKFKSNNWLCTYDKLFLIRIPGNCELRYYEWIL